MKSISATEVRKEWSSVIDSVVRERPVLVKRTRDYVIMSDTETIDILLEVYGFTAKRFFEEDGTVTLSLNEIDLVENAPDEKGAKKLLAKSIREYARDFYEEYSVWSKAPNRKPHIPYIFKVLLAESDEEIEDMIVCQDGLS